MLTLINGPIVGLGARTFISEAKEEARKDGNNLRVFHFAEEITKATGFDFLSFMSLNDFQRNAIRENIFRAIADQIKDTQDDVVIRVVTTVEWRDVNQKFKDVDIISKLLKPDRIVTLMDSEKNMLSRMQSTIAEGNELSRLTRDYLRIGDSSSGEEEVLDWLNEEVSIGEDWAKSLNIRQVVFSVNESPSALARLCTQKDLKCFYVSYPMTFLTQHPEFREQKDKLVEGLSSRGVVIDPMAVELVKNASSAATAYTVERDLHWIVKKVDAVVGIQPDPPVFSFGMLDEFQHAKGYGVPSFMIFPAGSGGPFGEDQFLDKSRMFKDLASLLASTEFNKLFPES